VTAETKAAWRRRLLAARRALGAAEHAAEAAALARHVLALATAGGTVCAYVPVGGEPGSPAMLDALRGAGMRVLLPVVCHDEAGRPLPLRWGEYRPDTLVPGAYGLREPAPPHLPAGAVAGAAVLLIPALAVDRSGVRLGRGAGFYDRTLPLADPAARRVAVVRDEELVDALPAEPHDVRMTHALTPGRGLVALGVTSHGGAST